MDAVTVVEVAPAGIVAIAGTVTAALPDVREIPAPPEGAAPERFSVHVLEVPPFTDAGEQVMEDRTTAAGPTVTEVDADVPPEAAVMLITADPRLEAVAVNVPVVAPPPTVTEGGMGR